MTTTQPLEKLIEEHRIIQRVLSALETMTQDLENGFPQTFFEVALEFLSEFADHCHVAKEEERLFPLLWEKGLSLERGPLGPLMAEHERGRRQLNAMRLYLEAARQGRPEAILVLVAEIGEYVRTMREHLETEESRLFHEARSLFTTHDWERLRRDFEEVEQDDMGKAFHARYESIAERLIAAVPRLRSRSSA